MGTPNSNPNVRALEERLRSTAVNFSAGNLTLGELKDRLEAMSKTAYLLVATVGENERARTHDQPRQH